MSEVPLYEAYSKIWFHNARYTPKIEMRTFINQGPHTDRVLCGR